jgi:hypothetical protein
MSAFLQFAGQHPITAVFLGWVAFSISLALVWLASAVIEMPFNYGFRAYNRRLCSRNISLRGWPPPHLDADGDAVQTETHDS